MGSRSQQERKGGSPNLFPGCKSLGSYEGEWAELPEREKIPLKHLKEHKQRGGQSNHGLIVDPGQDLGHIPVHHPTKPGRRRSYSAH
jgi:hypothetical protein